MTMTTVALLLADTQPYGKNQSDWLIIVGLVIIVYVMIRRWWKKR